MSVTKTETKIVIEPKLVPTITLNKDQQKRFDGCSNISSKIRFLAVEGYSTSNNKYGMIARFMGKRTQHVRNVLTQPLKKG